jgi:hypothetical protein
MQKLNSMKIYFTDRSRLTRVRFCAVSNELNWKIYTTLRIYAPNFRLNAILHRRSWPHLSFAWGQQKVTPLSHHQVTWMYWLRRWYNHTVRIVSSSTAFDFLNNENWDTWSYVISGNPSEKSARDEQFWMEIRCHKPTWLWYIFNRNWVDTRWQQYSTVHIYTQTVHRI